MSTNNYVRIQTSDYVLCSGKKKENLPALVSRKIRKRKILVITDYSLIVFGTKC
jgi:hypothetical protein